MSKNEIKKVSNLTIKIGKAMDIINTKDFDLIYSNLQLLKSVDAETTRQIKKYADNPYHELDFTVFDLADLSDAILNYIQNSQYEFTYHKYKKYFENKKVITGADFDVFSSKVARERKMDFVLREIYKSLSFNAIIYDLWSKSEDKKDFVTQILDCLQSLY